MNQRYLGLTLSIMLFVVGCGGDDVKIVSMEPTTMNFNAKTQSTKVVAKGLELRGNPVPGVQFSYRSDNSAVAEVSADGMVTPVSNGTATIIATTADGKKGETFVKVCMPQEIICDPAAVLNLRVGTAAPIKCHMVDCKGETIPGTLEYVEESKESLFKDPNEEGTFVGKLVGTTKVTVKGGGLEKDISVVVAEQLFAPGMKPGSGGGGGGGGGGGAANRNKDPYNEGGGGQFNHILGNMKF